MRVVPSSAKSRTKPRRKTAAPSARARLEALASASSPMPVEELEALISLGEAAAEEIGRSLRAEAGSVEFSHPLFLLVAAGEVRSPQLVPVLIEALSAAAAGEDATAAMAAMEALVKTGEPAVPALVRFLEQDPEIAARIYAYGALGHLHSARAAQALGSALSTEEELLDVVGHAFARHRVPGSLETLYQAYARAPHHLDAPLEEALRLLGGVDEIPPHPVEQNWRVRYRRRPQLDGGIAPGWESLAALAHGDAAFGARARPRHAGKRSLLAILAPEASLPPSWVDVEPAEPAPPGYCPHCGRHAEEVAGLRICPALARASLAVQRHMLESWRERGGRNLFRQLDELDLAQADLHTKEAGLAAGDEESADRSLFQHGLRRLAFAEATLTFLIEEGCRTLAEGMACLSSIEKRAPALSREILTLHGLQAE